MHPKGACAFPNFCCCVFTFCWPGILFLLTLRYEPARIAHYPNDIIDIIVTDPVQIPISPPVAPSGLLLSQTNGEHSNLITSMRPSTNSIGLKMSNLSLRPLPSATSTILTQTLLNAPFPPLHPLLLPLPMLWLSRQHPSSDPWRCSRPWLWT